ncbi:MAG: Mur ligase family protein, partial [Oscillospiraceae bacterium]|nr:Mur ligase family protein [Oscillospiraceae bacterium]
MDNDLKSYFEGMKGKKVFFLGAGKSNAQLITKYASFGSQVTLCDIREENELSSYIEAFGGLDISLNLGVNYLSNLSEADIIFRTPGIDYTKQEIQKAVLAGVVVTSEIEMFFRFCPCLTIGITGSDGKTTTSSLIAAILEKAGYMVWLGGNIGRPLFPLVEEMKKEDIAVVELSSFQLISMKQSPDISLITNITPNHLDHHKDMQEYIDAKRNILLYQNSNSVAVLNRDNSVTSLLASDVQGELRYFRRKPVEHGSYIRNNTLYFSSSAHLATSDNTEINGESSDID